MIFGLFPFAMHVCLGICLEVLSSPEPMVPGSCLDRPDANLRLLDEVGSAQPAISLMK